MKTLSVRALLQKLKIICLAV